MSCSPFDLRDYFLKELPAAGSREVEAHLTGCPACREELDRWRIAEAALLALRDEEIPQRIAFVSDKVFEPSRWRRWWAMFWGSGARLGFASAAMLSVAILFSALTRATGPVSAPAPQPAPMAAAAVTQEQLDRRVNEAVTKAATEIEERQTKKTAEIVAALEKRYELDRRGMLLAMEQSVDYLQKKHSQYVVAASGYGPPRGASGVSQ
jgi:anti-sigma factor RsiW